MLLLLFGVLSVFYLSCSFFIFKMSSVDRENPSSLTGGTRPINIEGRLARERERLLGMTDEERNWRKQWLRDQHLSPNEPKFVPEAYYELNNPIRRFYRAPLDMLFKAFEPTLVNIALNLKLFGYPNFSVHTF